MKATDKKAIDLPVNDGKIFVKANSRKATKADKFEILICKLFDWFSKALFAAGVIMLGMALIMIIKFFVGCI